MLALGNPADKVRDFTKRDIWGPGPCFDTEEALAHEAALL